MRIRSIKTPQYFTLDRRYVRRFVRILDDLYHTKRDGVHLNFRKTKVMSRGDMMVLQAQLEKIEMKKSIKFFFSSLSRGLLNDLFSGDVMRLQKRFSPSEAKIDADKIQEIDPMIIDNIAKNLKRIGINKNNNEHAAYYERVEALLTEIIGNAVEHGIRNRDINCWLIIDVDSRKKEVVFTFVDMGEGIVSSHRKGNLSFKYKLLGDLKIVKDSLFGRLPSSTGAIGRGQGLPEIKSIVEKKIVINFELITNRVVIDYNNNRFNSKKIPNFAGTYYSWAVTKSCFEEWKNTQ
jgi:hypothetical protein